MSEQMQEEMDLIEEQMDATFSLVEKNAEAQAAFLENWMNALENNSFESENFAEGLEGFSDAYKRWMDASEEMVELWRDSAQGEDIDIEDFRNLWLKSANEAFSDIMSTTAFAQATGETVGNALEVKKQMDDAANQTLHELGFATASDIDEVGERLVELERRQHKLEQKIDELIEKIDGL